uniref:Isoaspartyl peptidase/L-asparaginase n=1 Tax=Erpetoichthys calabaricus TaxID=27687 RepID=A0A8C4T9J3_ERPCA
MKPVIMVHGGAYAIPDAFADECMAAVKTAALEGFKVLVSGRSAVDAVESSVRSLEDNPILNAGHGAALNTNGEVELDALIMDGKTLAAGAVSSIKNISNPVTFARSVIEKTEHVMLTGTGADQFADCQGFPRVDTNELISEKERRNWEHRKRYGEGVQEQFNSQWVHDTVGAVALDSEGNVACATSTGGMCNKMVGRVGDSPIIGSGGYADNNIGAVSCTGHGESIMKVTLARLILFHMEQGKSAEEAAEEGLHYMGSRVGGGGGAIVVGRAGDWTARFTTERMAWASVKETTLSYGLNPNQVEVKLLQVV